MSIDQIKQKHITRLLKWISILLLCIIIIINILLISHNDYVMIIKEITLILNKYCDIKITSLETFQYFD